MMNLGAPEMLLLGILALILFGPRRLPELGKALGEGLAAFRESSRQLSSEFKRQLEEETAVPPAPAAIPAEVLMGTPMQAAAPVAALMAAEAEAAADTAAELPETSAIGQEELAEIFDGLEPESDQPKAALPEPAREHTPA